jgi:hypothetical protein
LKKKTVKAILVLLVIILFGAELFAQSENQSDKLQKDIGDFITTRSPGQDEEIEIKKLYMPVLPIIGYAPANGFVIGIGLAPAMLLDSSIHTHMSSVQANIQFTSKSQRNINIRHNIYTRKDRFIFQGDWRLLFFSQPTYGLGVYDFPPIFSFMGLTADEGNGAQPMSFNYLRVYETVLRKVYRRLYVGVGFALDYHWKINDELLNLDTASLFITSHYSDSKIENYTPAKYTANGILIRTVFDNRDNTVNAYSGMYLDLGFRLNSTTLGSDRNSTQLQLEARKFIELKENKQHLAFWLLGNIILSGNVPYLALPSIGWDTYNRSGRGFIQGRYRGRNMIYGEAEWRFGLSRSGLLGGVVFLNTITTDNRYADLNLGESFAFGYGAGLRIKMSKETRTNICVDFGMGNDGSKGIWFGLSETF